MTWAYTVLLRLYPNDYRERFGEEMTAVFARVVEERRGHGQASSVSFVLGELLGLVRGAAAAWKARLGGSSLREQALDLRMMRPVWVTRQSYVAAIDEVLEAQRRVEDAGTRFDWEEDRWARENLRRVRRKYRIAG